MCAGLILNPAKFFPFNIWFNWQACRGGFQSCRNRYRQYSQGYSTHHHHPFFFKRKVTVMQNLFAFYFFYMSVDTNSSSECSHFYPFKTQLQFNLLLPKNSYLGCDFCFNICGQGQQGCSLRLTVGKGRFRTGACLCPGEIGREEKRNRAEVWEMGQCLASGEATRKTILFLVS